jgi:hypothetical protein
MLKEGKPPTPLSSLKLDVANSREDQETVASVAKTQHFYVRPRAGVGKVGQDGLSDGINRDGGRSCIGQQTRSDGQKTGVGDSGLSDTISSQLPTRGSFSRCANRASMSKELVDPTEDEFSADAPAEKAVANPSEDLHLVPRNTPLGRRHNYQESHLEHSGTSGSVTSVRL